MPRMRDSRKHPALGASSSGLSLKRAQELEEDNTARIAGWETFTAMQKRFLLAYPYFNSIQETCDYLRCSRTWVWEQKTGNPLFSTAMEQRQMILPALARESAMHLLGKSILALDDLITSNAGGIYPHYPTTMKAIEHLHRIARLAGDEAPAGSTFIKTDQIQMFDYGQKETVVEGTVHSEAGGPRDE
jgi:hypothetical protein